MWYTVYEIATGQILSYSLVQPGNLPFLSAGQALVEGKADPATQMIVDGQIVDRE